MKKNLSDYIKENVNLRQLLLKQDGGIMKFWAEHPDKDFDVDLFEDYENQIVKDYLQANKQNRAVRTLPKDKLKNKSLDWYHQSKGSELKFIVALKSELNAIDSDLYVQFLNEVEIYMVDAYKESRRRKYPDGISPLDFYNEVIEKYGPCGLSLDCLERVLQEYRGNAVHIGIKHFFLANIVHPDESSEWEEVNNLQTEFDIRMFVGYFDNNGGYIGDFVDNGGYKKLRQAIKEIIDNGTQNLTKGKCREICCKIAEDNMRKVNQFTRWVNNESFPLEEIEEGLFTPLITPEERSWLHNIMYVNLPGEKGTKKLTDMGGYFSHFLSILRNIGMLWAAQLLVRGIDMKELEKKTGVIMNRRSGFLYYVDRFVDGSQRGECFIYDWPEAEKLLAQIKSIKEDNVAEGTGGNNASNKSKPGRKETSFKDFVVNTDECNNIITLIKKHINIDEPKQVAFVIMGGIEAGKIRQDVTAPSIEKEFGVNGNSIKPHLGKYKTTRGKLSPHFSEEELKPYKELFLEQS